MNKYNSLDISFGQHSISFSLHNCEIKIKRWSIDKTSCKCFFEIKSVKGNREYQSNIFEKLPDCFKVPVKLKDGLHRLSICFRSPYEDSYYNLFCPQNGIPFRKQGKCLEFIPSPICECNQSFLDLQKKRLHNGDLIHGLESSNMIQSSDSEIKGLAEELTRNSADTISKIKDIYFYVSRTLSYDKLALEKGSYCYTGQTAYEAFKNNKCVCQGFANLTVAMCRAIGIPCFAVSAFVKPNNKQWEELGDESSQCSKHQIAIAWANCYDRWVIMDPTWDNDQYYDANGYGARHGSGLLYKYFDITTEFISYTHRFKEILNI